MPVVVPRYVVDENLVRVGRALASLRDDVVCFGDEIIGSLLPLGAFDSDWIPVVGARGLIMITDDKRLRTRPIEAQLCIDHHVRIVHLHEAGHLTAWAQNTRLVTRWDAIERYVEANPDGPWWLSIRSNHLKALRFQPGARA